MTLLAAFQTLLGRYADTEEIVVGSPAAGRDRVETESLIGYFVNMLVLRTDLSGDPTFLELLKRVRDTVIEAQAHPDVPFERLIDELGFGRSLRYAPLFQVMFAFQNLPRSPAELTGLTATPVSVRSGAAEFDLTLEITQEENRLDGSLGYRTDLFDLATVDRMLEHFERLLEGIVKDPGRRLSQLPLSSETERRRLLIEWNDTAAEFPRRKCIHRLLEEQAERTPEATAVVCGGEQSTYRELDRRANQLANCLRRFGAGPGMTVALCTERSVEMTVGMLGILKSGAAYLPLDPTYPRERLSLVLEETETPLLLAQERLASSLPPFRGQLVLLDADRAAIELESRENPHASVSADDLAYVIYTSGSTGRPKGVEITHRALANFVLWARGAFGLGPADRVLQFAPFHFDTSVEEIFPCLASGATLVFRTDEMLESPEAFFRGCVERRITVLDLPTAYWHELVPSLERGDASLPLSLRLVVIGGEGALPERLAQWLRAVGGRVRLLNTYGPTEATVAATIADLSSAELERSPDVTTVPIGRPISNMRAYVLDSCGQPVPIGARGELYLSGEGLARGYRNDPVLTARQFTPNPFTSVPGSRLYRTGDIARYRRDGMLEFLGRADDQEKIRGFRVEPAEAEQVLITHPSISEAAVVPRKDVTGNSKLVAYLTTGGKSEPAVAELRDFLAQRLPDYLIPQAFVWLPKLPRTSTGKLDRAALPAPSRADSSASHLRRPHNTLERLVAGAWCQVFGLDRVGLDDDFFALGGHSLMATRVLSRLRAGITLDLPLRLLFEHPTVAGLSDAIARLARKTGAERELTGGARP
jgi:amino acid adenylation domain-containing protein